MYAALSTIAILIISVCGAFGHHSRLNLKRCQAETQPIDSATVENQVTSPVAGDNATSQSSRHGARTGSFSIPGLAGWTGICLALAATLAGAAIWRHCRPKVVLGRCRRIVEEAEACGKVYPEKTQQAFRCAIRRLRPVQSALAQRCPWHSDSDRVFFHLMMPATARLRDEAQDILGRAEFGIGLSLMSQDTTTQRAANTILGARAPRMAWSCVAARELAQFSAELQDEAIRHLEMAVALAPKRSEYLCALARAYESADRNDDSLAVIQAAITRDPGVDEYYRVLASVAWKTGAYELYNRGLLGIVENSGRCSHGRSGGL